MVRRRVAPSRTMWPVCRYPTRRGLAPTPQDEVRKCVAVCLTGKSPTVSALDRHRPVHQKRRKRLTRKIEFHKPIQHDLGLPDGTPKIICFSSCEIDVLFAPSRRMQRGVRVVTIRGVREAVDATASRAREIAGRPQALSCAVSDCFPRRTSDVVAYGKTVWSWCPLLASSFAKARDARPGSTSAANSRSDGGKTNSSPRRARHKPSNHCAGKAGLSRRHLWLFLLCILCNLCRTGGHGCRPAPGLPCALSRWKRDERSSTTRACRAASVRCYGRLA